MPTESSLNTPEAYKAATRPDRWVAELAAEQWGVLSSEELRRCGLSLNAIAVRARNGWLHPLYRGVYAVGHCNLPLNGRFLAAVKACGPTAVLSHYSAAALYELVRWDDRPPRGHDDQPADPQGHPHPPLLNARTSRHHAPSRHPDDHPR